MEILKRNLNAEATQKSYKKVVWFYDFWRYSRIVKQLLIHKKTQTRKPIQV